MTPPPIALPAGVTRQPGHGGLERLRIETATCTGEIYLHGAHVTAWQPRGAAPVIWMSRASVFAPGRPIRGGIPICFPWFGPHPSDSSRPAHGFARLRLWTLDAVERTADDAVAVTLSLQTGAETRELWPHRSALTFTAIFGPQLSLELRVRNLGDDACAIQEALHTYFAVGDIRAVAIEGLAGATYLDKVRNGARCVQDAAPIRFAGETDRPYLDTEATTTIVDTSLARRIVIEKRGSRTTVVWNPWIAKAAAMPDFGDDEWPSMVCVETANAVDNALTLAPGAEHRLQALIRVE